MTPADTEEGRPDDVLPARFEPLRRATRTQRVLAFVAGPFVWLAGIVVVAYVVGQRDAVEIALLVVAVSFAVALGVLVLARRARVRAEQQPPEERDP